MGDRSNVQFRFGGDDAPMINLYGHWAGPNMIRYTQKALDSDPARGRWNDESYLTRILVQSILGQAGVTSGMETGWGLSPVGPDDNEYPILLVNVRIGRVSIDGDDESYSFQEFCRLPDESLMDLIGVD